jgi:hypothetical protein
MPTPTQVFSLTKPCTPPVVMGQTFAPDVEYNAGLWVTTVNDDALLAKFLQGGYYSRLELEECKSVVEAYALKVFDIGTANLALVTACAATAAASATALNDDEAVVTALAAKIAADSAKTTADAAATAADAAKTTADAAYAAAFATGTLTSDGTAPADGATVTLDAKTYTFKTALTPTEGQVLIGATTDASAALANLKSAINHTGTPDTDYKCAAVHPTVSAGAITATTLVLTAKSAGAGGDSIASTETSSHLSFGGTTLLRDPALASAASAADAAATAADAAAATADSDATAADTAYTDALSAAATAAAAKATDRSAQATALAAYAEAEALLDPILATYRRGTRALSKKNPFKLQEFTVSAFPVPFLAAQIDFGPDGKIYGCANNFGVDMSIHRIDPVTGVDEVFYTSTLLDAQINDLRWAPDGFLYLIGVNVGDSKHYFEKVSAAGAHVSQVDLTGKGMSFPSGLEVNADASDFYFADVVDHAVYQMTAAGTVTTLAGDVGVSGLDDGAGTAAKFHGPLGLAFTQDFLALLVCDAQNNSIRKIVLDGAVVSTVAGSTSGASGNLDGIGTAALMYDPQYIRRMPSIDGGRFYFNDNLNATIRVFDLPSGAVQSICPSNTDNGVAAGVVGGVEMVFSSGAALHKVL